MMQKIIDGLIHSRVDDEKANKMCNRKKTKGERDYTTSAFFHGGIKNLVFASHKYTSKYA